MAKEQKWCALVKIKPLKGNEILTDAKGAYVNIACICTDEENLKKKIREVFTYHRCKVLSIEDIEREHDFVANKTDNSEKSQLFNDLWGGVEFTWGTFHSW